MRLDLETIGGPPLNSFINRRNCQKLICLETFSVPEPPIIDFPIVITVCNGQWEKFRKSEKRIEFFVYSFKVLCVFKKRVHKVQDTIGLGRYNENLRGWNKSERAKNAKSISCTSVEYIFCCSLCDVKIQMASRTFSRTHMVRNALCAAVKICIVGLQPNSSVL